MDDPGSADRGLLQSVVADGQWHLYEWNLEDDDQWEPWASGDGSITGATVTIDSIFFHGDGDASIYLDTVAHNPGGSLLPQPGDCDTDGDVDAEDLTLWQAGFGTVSDAALTDGDGDSDGDVDGSDFLAWQQNLTLATSATVLAEAVPEPATWLLALLGTVLGPLTARK